MKTAMRCTFAMLAVLATAACGEQDQALVQGKAQIEPPAYSGTGVEAFTAPGWKAGDRASWEQETKARAQRGQNEYSRVN